MYNRGRNPESYPVGASEMSMDPQLAALLGLGTWTEPILLACGRHERHPEQQANLEKLLKLCCEAAQDVTQANGAAIAVRAVAVREETAFIYRINRGEVVHPIGTPIISGYFFPAACINSRQVFLSNRAFTEQRIDPALRRRGIKSLLVVPMLKSGDMLGFLEMHSRNENQFNAKHVISLQFIAAVVARASSDLQQWVWDTPSSDNPLASGTEASTEMHSDSSANGVRFSSNSELAENPELAEVIPPVQLATAVPEITSAPKSLDSGGGQHSASLTKAPTELIEQSTSEPSSDVARGANDAAERRRRSRTLVDCLAYVSLEEENGGILLDINDAGFSMQIVLPFDPAGARQRRARLTGNADLEADCELVWAQGGQAGFRFSNVSATLHLELESWIAANGITPL